MMPSNITVSGDFNIEIVLDTFMLPKNLETVNVEELDLSCGGEGYIFSSYLSSLGASVKVIGCVGNDLYGKIIVSSLNQKGVSTDYITGKAGSTGTLIKISAKGEKAYLSYKGVNALKDGEYFKNSFKNIRGSDYFLFGTDENFEAVSEIVNHSFDNNVKIIYAVSSFKGMSKKAIKMCNFLIITDGVAENLLEMTINDEYDMKNAVKKLTEFTNAEIILFKEDFGAVIKKDFDEEFVKCYNQKENNNKDSFNVFMAGFITALLKKASLTDSADFGLFVSSASKIKGEIPSIRSLKAGEFKNLITKERT